MGFTLSSIQSISIDDRHEYYLFYWGNYWFDEFTQWIDENFNQIAKELGPKGVIVRGLNERVYDKEILEAYKVEFELYGLSSSDIEMSGEMHNLFDSLTGDEWDREFYMKYSPFFILTDRNPNKLDYTSSIFYLIPLGMIKTKVELKSLLGIIVECIKKSEFTKLDDFFVMNFGEKPVNAIDRINEVIELKPNFIGVGLNLNKIIELLNSKRKE